MAKQQKAPKTYSELARRLDVSVRTIENWRDFSDWPDRKSNGSFCLKSVKAFCLRNQLGPSNPRRDPASKGGRNELVDVQKRWLLERAANLRIGNERLETIQKEELVDLLSVEDVRPLFRRTLEIVMATYRAYAREIRSLMASRPTDQAEWTKQREQIMAVTGRLPHDISKAMRALNEKV